MNGVSLTERGEMRGAAGLEEKITSKLRCQRDRQSPGYVPDIRGRRGAKVADVRGSRVQVVFSALRDNCQALSL